MPNPRAEPISKFVARFMGAKEQPKQRADAAYSAYKQKQKKRA